MRLRLENEPSDSDDSSNSRSGRDSVSTPIGVPEEFLTSHILLYSYATAIIILALGLAVLVNGLTFLCFFYPEKAQPFLILLASPIIGVLIANASKIKFTIRKISHGNGNGTNTN